MMNNYIESLNDEEVITLFKIMLLKMQDQIIGYINVYSDIYEPAISESETLMPLKSFGLVNTHIYGKFIPFPDNKKLSDMLKDPIKFNDWCKENNIK